MTNDTSATACENLAIFPCLRNSKLPATKNGFLDAMFYQNPQVYLDKGFNYGVACEKSKILVIDQDYDSSKGYNGIELVKNLEKELGKLPVTFTVKTPRGGLHYYFLSDAIINPIGKIGQDVDIKFRGYVIGPGSSVNGKKYEAIDGIDSDGKLILSKLPQAWIDYLNKPQKSERTFSKQAKPKTYKNISTERLFANCKFLEHCKVNAEELSEPEWHSMISILAQIDGGDELIHELSAPYFNYSFNETELKIQHARSFGYPQTCAYLSGNYPAICSGCKSLLNYKGE